MNNQETEQQQGWGDKWNIEARDRQWNKQGTRKIENRNRKIQEEKKKFQNKPGNKQYRVNLL